MAYSDSTDFGQTAKTIIRDALILCGGLEDDEQPTGEQEAFALRALNRLCKSWSVKGLKAWCWDEATLPLVASTASYTIGPGATLDIDRPLRIENVRKVVNSDETPVRIASRQEYMDQPSKDSEGEPVMVFYDPKLDEGVMYIWPTPDAAHTLKFSYRRYIEDLDLATNDPYFPSEWLDAIVYNLAFRLCPKYEVTGEDRNTLAAMAVQFLQDAEDSDQEQGSLYLEPGYEY